MLESYDSAEAVLDELLPIIDSSQGHVSTLLRGFFFIRVNSVAISQTNVEYQEIRWLRLAVLRRRKAGENALLAGKFLRDGAFAPIYPSLALKSIIDHMEISEENFKELNNLIYFGLHMNNLRLRQDSPGTQNAEFVSVSL